MNNYSIIIPNEKAPTYRIVTLIITILNILVFGFVFFKTGENNFRNLALMGMLMNIAALVFFLVAQYSKYRISFKVEINFIISAVLWIIIGNYLIACLLGVFAILGFYTNKELRIQFTKEGIRYPSFPPKVIGWNEVVQVLIKDDILTIDLKNNQLLQFNVDRKSNNTDTMQFNDFCKQHLS